VFVELPLQESEVAPVQFDPEPLALEVLEPAGTQVAPPVVLHPAADSLFAKIVTGFLAHDPHVAEGADTLAVVMGSLLATRPRNPPPYRSRR
jgi:hypothetical protein